ncbi:MAG: hypothetical protein ACLTTW_02990 [Coprobacter sp.]
MQIVGKAVDQNGTTYYKVKTHGAIAVYIKRILLRIRAVCPL